MFVLFYYLLYLFVLHSVLIGITIPENDLIPIFLNFIFYNKKEEKQFRQGIFIDKDHVLYCMYTSNNNKQIFV